jgi:hypothetical protein
LFQFIECLARAPVPYEPKSQRMMARGDIRLARDCDVQNLFVLRIAAGGAIKIGESYRGERECWIEFQRLREGGLSLGCTSPSRPPLLGRKYALPQGIEKPRTGTVTARETT